MAQSEFHFFLLFSDSIAIISKITYNIVHTENIGRGIFNMYYDKNTNSIWLVSIRHIYQITIENEDRDVWREYLEIEDYQMALDHCERKGLPEGKKVARLYALNMLENKKYIAAASLFGKSDEKFEEVTLKFLTLGDYDALKGKKCILLKPTSK